MTKRRRERDRPKAGPDAYYNPHKRVLLSYADEEEELAEAPLEQRPIRDAELARYQIDEYPDEDEDAATGAERNTNIGEKQARPSKQEQQKEGNTDDCSERAQNVPSALESTLAEEDQKSQMLSTADKSERHGQTKGNWKPKSQRDVYTGQFASLGAAYEEDGDEDGETGYDSTTEEAMAYLNSVRNERQDMPDVLSARRPLHVAQDETEALDHEEPSFDHSAFYDDEAYIGSPNPKETVDEDPTDPRHAFTLSLKSRFLSHRKLLRQTPEIDALAALSSAYPISFPQNSTKAYNEWHSLLSSKPPKLAQLQSLEQDAVFSLLTMLEKQFLVKGKNVKANSSSWMWSLLARLEEVGNMMNNEVYRLRELGKKAVLIQLSLTNPAAADMLEAAESDDATNGTEAGQTTKLLPKNSVTENTRATLDMILVVVGDIFGQRDLLEFREAWTTAEVLG